LQVRDLGPRAGELLGRILQREKRVFVTDRTGVAVRNRVDGALGAAESARVAAALVTLRARVGPAHAAGGAHGLLLLRAFETDQFLAELDRFERTGEELVYHDMAQEWRALTGLPFVSAVWGAARGSVLDENVADDFIRSRDHGLQNIQTLVAEWAPRMALSEETISTYLTTNIHYVLDKECIEGMKGFFRMAAACGVLPEYRLNL